MRTQSIWSQLSSCTQIQEEKKNTRAHHRAHQSCLLGRPTYRVSVSSSEFSGPFLHLFFLKITSPLVVPVGNIQSFHKYLLGIYPQSRPTEPAGYHSVNALYNKALTINICENNLMSPPELCLLFLLRSCPYFFAEQWPGHLRTCQFWISGIS